MTNDFKTKARELFEKIALSSTSWVESEDDTVAIIEKAFREAADEVHAEREACAMIADHQAQLVGQNCSGCVERERACVMVSKSIRARADARGGGVEQ